MLIVNQYIFFNVSSTFAPFAISFAIKSGVRFAALIGSTLKLYSPFAPKDNPPVAWSAVATTNVFLSFSQTQSLL